METEADILKTLEFETPTVIEGTPGIGHVGKLVVEHIIDELDAEKFAEIYSPHLPPESLVESGRSKPATIQLYGSEEHDLILVTSDYLSVDNEGHYHITDELLNVVEEHDSELLLPIGGLDVSEEGEEAVGGGGLQEGMQEAWRTGGMGAELESPDVYGVVNDLSLRDRMMDAGVKFDPDTTFGGVACISGLLLSLGERRGLNAAYLMGEVSGNHLVNPVTCEAVLEAVTEIVGLEIDTSSLEDRSIEIEGLAMDLAEDSPTF